MPLFSIWYATDVQSVDALYRPELGWIGIVDGATAPSQAEARTSSATVPRCKSSLVLQIKKYKFDSQPLQSSPSICVC